MDKTEETLIDMRENKNMIVKATNEAYEMALDANAHFKLGIATNSPNFIGDVVLAMENIVAALTGSKDAIH